MEQVLLAALAVAFVISLIDYWVDLKFIRIVLSVVLAAGALVALDSADLDAGLAEWLTLSLAAGFVAISAIQVLERVTRIAVSYRGR